MKSIFNKQFLDWWKEHKQDYIFDDSGTTNENLHRATAFYAWCAAVQSAANIAIQKEIGNGHMETCAAIADAIRQLAPGAEAKDGSI